MKVILLQDVANLGKKYDAVEVKDGYARNFLISKGLAKKMTKESLKWAEGQKEIKIKKEEMELEEIQKLASSIDGIEVIVPVKIGESAQLFESINQQKIVEKLKEMGFDIKKSQINLEKPIKELGEFPVKINFSHNLEAEINVVIVEEKSEKKPEEI